MRKVGEGQQTDWESSRAAAGWNEERGRRTGRWTERRGGQLTVASLNATEAEQEALCKYLLVWVSKR